MYQVDVYSISAITYIKQGDFFVPIDSWNGTFYNKTYIDGAIELVINDVVLIDLSMWDYVNYLWLSILDGIEHVARDEDFDCVFPDQSILMSFLVKGVNVQISIMNAKVFVSRNQLVCHMAGFALQFFSFLRSNLSINHDVWDQCIARAKKLIELTNPTNNIQTYE